MSTISSVHVVLEVHRDGFEKVVGTAASADGIQVVIDRAKTLREDAWRVENEVEEDDNDLTGFDESAVQYVSEEHSLVA
jgi:hypothetical protein